VKKYPIVLVALAIGAMACTGSSSSEPEVTAPPPATSGSGSTATGSTPDSADVEPPEGTSTTSTQAETTTTEAVAALPTTTEGVASAIGGSRVDSVPGVDSPGEIIELLDGVWVFIPSETDPDDPNVVPPLPEDAEILAAYAEAQAAYHEQASREPLDPEPSARLEAAILDGGQLLAENILRPQSEAGRHLDLSDGIVLRPVVIADPRSDTEAFIFDCQFDGTVFVDADGGLADGQAPGVKEFPQIASLVRVDGRWIVDRLTRDERACA
jgi:hypothetical protein